MLTVAIFHSRSATNVNAESFSAIDLGLFGDTSWLAQIFNNQTILVYVAPIAIVIAHVVMYKSPFGLRVRTVGQNPDAAQTAGVSVSRVQWISMLTSGVMCGVAGVFISLNSLAMYTENMVAGAASLYWLNHGRGRQSAGRDDHWLSVRIHAIPEPDLVWARHAGTINRDAAVRHGDTRDGVHKMEKHKTRWRYLNATGSVVSFRPHLWNRYMIYLMLSIALSSVINIIFRLLEGKKYDGDNIMFINYIWATALSMLLAAAKDEFRCCRAPVWRSRAFHPLGNRRETRFF